MMNRCDSVIEGARCEGFTTHVYRTPWVTRLICDDCTRRYSEESADPGAHQEPVEFTLHELTPARHLLLDRLAQTRAAYAKLKVERQLQAAEGSSVLRLQAINSTCWIVSMVLSVTLLSPWVLLPEFVVWVVVATALSHRAKTRLALGFQEINQRFGFPELTL